MSDRKRWQNGERIVVVDTDGIGRRYIITSTTEHELTIVPDPEPDAVQMIPVPSDHFGEVIYIPGRRVEPLEQIRGSGRHATPAEQLRVQQLLANQLHKPHLEVVKPEPTGRQFRWRFYDDLQDDHWSRWHDETGPCSACTPDEGEHAEPGEWYDEWGILAGGHSRLDPTDTDMADALGGIEWQP